jgi:hypothetical protein
MSIQLKYLFVVAIVLVCLICCAERSILEPGANDGAAIYIGSDDIRDDETTQLDQLTLVQPAFLSASDMTSYKWSEHHITYADSVWERLKTWGDLLHRVFVVAVGNERIYWGRFMDDGDSGSCQNPVIKLIPRHPDGRNSTPSSIRIDRGYPEYFGTGPDPRVDPRIYQALEREGVLAP